MRNGLALLKAGPWNQYQSKRSAWASGFPSLSLSESSGGSAEGHWMPMVGSFQARQRSWAGA